MTEKKYSGKICELLNLSLSIRSKFRNEMLLLCVDWLYLVIFFGRAKVDKEISTTKCKLLAIKFLLELLYKSNTTRIMQIFLNNSSLAITWIDNHRHGCF